MSETVILGTGSGERCIACNFSVEALVDALESGSFEFCAAHLLRATSYVAASVGERHLRAIPTPPRPSG